MIELSEVLLPVGAMAALGIILSLILAFANKKLFVPEDPRIERVSDLLPQTNCGACGQPGCHAFAEAAVSGGVSPAECTVNPPEQAAKIAELLGVDVGARVERVARLACAGGSNVARQRALYEGYPSCQAAALVGGGGKGCTWGCLGLADCEVSCDFDAIHMDEHDLPVVDAVKCTACGDCVDACPKDLFSIQPVANQLWVACKNLLMDEQAEDECAVACTGCGLCAADAPEGVITMQNNLPVVNYGGSHSKAIDSIERCPTGAIVWWQGEVATKGAKAKKIVRQSALPGPSTYQSAASGNRSESGLGARSAPNDNFSSPS